MATDHSRRRSFIVSSGVVLGGALALGWGLVLLPSFWQQSSIERIAARVLGGATFSTETLVRYLPQIEAAEQARLCRPAALRSAAILRLHMFEHAVASAQRIDLDSGMEKLRDAVRRALACSPADSYLWLILYWVENAREGFSEDKLAYLRMSYRLGGNEGWIALKRNRAALAIFNELTPDLKDKAASEFISLVTNQFYREASAIYVEQQANVRELLVMRVARLEDNHRRALDAAAAERGYALGVFEREGRNVRP